MQFVLRRLWVSAVVASAVCLAMTLVLLAIGPWIDPSQYRIQFTNRCYLGVLSTDIALFNNPAGPYHGSILYLIEDEKAPSPLAEEVGWGRRYGIYYRYFRDHSGGVLWSLLVSLVYPLVLFAILPGICAVNFWRNDTLRSRCWLADATRRPRSGGVSED